MSDPSGTFSGTPRTQVASDPALGLDASLLERRCKLTVLTGIVLFQAITLTGIVYAALGMSE